ncbi:MAG TPA: hypothetical protein PKK60_00115 [archaeon]|nr:hypothetical protein [archaeon]
MFIDKIIEENPKSDGEDIESKCTELIEVKDAIKRLNGESKTAVILKKNDNNYMIIGGGNKGYVVTAMVNGKNYSMSNKFDVVKESSEISVGGKVKIYPSRKVHNLDRVLESAKHFASRGTLAQTFNWETI